MVLVLLLLGTIMTTLLEHLPAMMHAKDVVATNIVAMEQTTGNNYAWYGAKHAINVASRSTLQKSANQSWESMRDHTDSEDKESTMDDFIAHEEGRGRNKGDNSLLILHWTNH